MFKRHPVHTVRRQSSPVSRAAQICCEKLEHRTLMSTINWTNRATTDNFSLYGANANLARSIVDRAIDDWEQVISNFNYTGGGNTFSLTVTAALRAAGSRGSTTNVIRNNSTQKKPISADISLDDDGGGGGWYFDTSLGSTQLPDDVEFDSLLTPFAANATAGQTGNDFYRTIVHEIGHAMGVTDDTTGYLRIGDFLTNGIADPVTPGETLRLLDFNGGGTDYTLTTMGGGHLFEGGGTYTGPIYPNDLMNDGRTVNIGTCRRQIISDADAFLLRDVYGYTIAVPSTLHTMYVTRNAGNAEVVLRGLSGSNSDTLVVDNENIVGSNVMFLTVNGYTTQMSASVVGSIVVNGGGGTDYLRVENNASKSTTLNGGDGDDFFDFGFTKKTLGLITGNTNVNGGNGSDQIFAYDNNTSGTLTYTITQGRFDRSNGWGGFFYAADIEFENVTTGVGADIVNVQSTFANSPVWIWSAGGTDTVNIGNSTNGIRGLNSDVVVNNDPSFTTLNINNGPDAGARSWNVDVSSTNYGYLFGMSPATIYWDIADIGAINLTCGSGVDTGLFVRSTETFNVNNSGANDAITVGASSASGLQGITGQLTIDNGPAFTTLTIDDTNSFIARTITIDETGGYNTISGMAPALLRFDSADVSTARVITGAGVDTVNVPRNDEDLVISSSGGGDVVNIGNTTEGVQSITGPLKVMNPPSFSTVNINDTGDTIARTATLDNITFEGGTFGNWTGLAPATIGYKYADLSAVNITFGSGADIVNIRQSDRTLNVNGNGGTDAVTIGGAANGAQSVLGELTFTNPPSFSAFTVNDAANTTARTATLDDFDIAGITYGRLTGLAPANINWKYNDTSGVTLINGSGNDILSIKRHQDSVAIQGTAGSDTVTIGGGPAGMNGVTAPITVNNTSGATTLVLDDAADSTVNSVNHTMLSATSGRVSGMSPSTIDYKPGEVTSVRLKTGTNGNSVVIAETAASTKVYYHPASVSDAVAVNSDGVGSAALYTDRSVSMNSLQIGNSGVMTQQVGSFTLRTNAITFAASAKLDLTDGDMILDYTGTSQLATVQLLINQARAGGAWTGAGITSTSAKNASLHNTTLGAMLSTDYKSVYGAAATFDGQTVDNTAVLVKYTYYGDTDFNGKVDGSDYARLDAKFNQQSTQGNIGGWFNGDCDGNGKIDGADYALIDAAFNSQGQPLRPGGAPGRGTSRT